jgi:hypothetical protein
MTFRSRVIAATVVAAALAVVLASLTSFLSTRNALTQSVDESLQQAARNPDDNFGGANSFLVLADGTTPGIEVAAGFVDATVTKFAKGKLTGGLFRTVVINNQTLREYIVGLPVGSPIAIGNREGTTSTTAADVFIAPFSGQIAELRNLVRTLLFVSAACCCSLFRSESYWRARHCTLSRTSPTTSRTSPRPATCRADSMRATSTSSDACAGHSTASWVPSRTAKCSSDNSCSTPRTNCARP